MEFLKKIIEMFEMHVVSNCHSGCCDTTVEVGFSDNEDNVTEGRRSRRGSFVSTGSRPDTPEPGHRFPVDDSNELRRRSLPY